jgi:glyoxylase-like metal-dependent hydrolase (beta-lactamase superfamily II)
MHGIAPGLWTLRYPLSVLGTRHGRTTTVIRLASGKLVIHSMAPFTAEDIARIRSAGTPAWLVEAMLLHDTYAAAGRASFPDLPFLGPPGFGGVVKFPVAPLLPAPEEWRGEIQVVRLRGAPRLEEHAFLHLPSRTLVVADLVFNFSAAETGWDRFFHRHLAGFKRYPGMSRIFRWFISDRAAFRESIGELLALDFDRIIPGHGEIIESGGKEQLRRAMADAGITG